MQLEDYLRELSRVRTLASDEERALWRRFKDGRDAGARQRLIEAYQPLVFRTALPYRARENIMDIIQEGTVGLIEATESYDYGRGVAFSLYAVHRIHGRMLDFLKREGAVDIACLEGAGEDGAAWKECLVDTAASVPEQAEAHELAGRLRQAMARLPDKERLVLEGVYFKSQAVQEVADALEVSASHIYRLQKSGVRRVRGMLARFMQYW